MWPITVDSRRHFTQCIGAAALALSLGSLPGSAARMKFEIRDGTLVIVKLPAGDLFNDKEGKPVGIQSRIGRRPVMAFGNSDGDLQMPQWT